MARQQHVSVFRWEPFDPHGFNAAEESILPCRVTLSDKQRDAIGIEAVVVNGEVAWADGVYTEARAGVVCELG